MTCDALLKEIILYVFCLMKMKPKKIFLISILKSIPTSCALSNYKKNEYFLVNSSEGLKFSEHSYFRQGFHKKFMLQ